MTVRVKVTPERDPTRIEGYCQIPSWPREQSVIAFTRLGDQWMLASSMALPSKLEQALVVKKCFDRTFEVLAEVQGQRNKPTNFHM